MSVGRAYTEISPPPRDLFAHDDLENEWWYYHGHLDAGARQFAFELCFFRRSTHKIRIGKVIPVLRTARHLRCAHFAVADLNAKHFHHGHRRALLTDAGAESDRYRVWVHGWNASLDNGEHRLQASIRGAACDLRLAAVKPRVVHAENGAFMKSPRQACGYFAYTRMRAAGEITIGREKLQVTGEAWMDREYGAFTFDDDLAGWVWLALQLDDGQEIMIYLLRDKAGAFTPYSGGVVVRPEGDMLRLSREDIETTPTDYWTSRNTGNVYPFAWSVRIPRVSASLSVRAQMRACELDTRGSTSLIYWEGPVDVTGELEGALARGRGFMELVGYESNPSRNGLYNFDTNNMPLPGWIANEFRLRLSGPGRTLHE